MTRLPASRLAEVRRLIAAGGSFAAIGRALGLSKGAVAGIVRRHLQAEWDAKPPPSPRPPPKRLRKPRAPQLIPAPAPPPPPPSPPAYYLHAAGPGACHWPLGDGRPWRFCAAARAPDSVYCAAHTAVAYQRNPKAWAA